MMMTKLFRFPESVYKHTILAELPEKPATIVNMIHVFRLTSATSPTTEPWYTRKWSIKTKKSRLREKVRTSDSVKSDNDWREWLAFDAKPDPCRPIYEEMMSEWASMWDGHLGRVLLIKHGMDLTNPSRRSMHSSPYGASPRQRQRKRNDLTKTLQKLSHRE